MTLLSGGKFFRGGLLPLLVVLWGGTEPQPPFPGLTLGPPGPGPTPCSLLEHRGRVAGFQLHVPSRAECQGAGPGLGMGPAGEIRRQQRWDTGKGWRPRGQGGTGRGALVGGGHALQAMASKSTGPTVRFRSPLIYFLDVWPCVNDCLPEPQSHILEDGGSYLPFAALHRDERRGTPSLGQDTP